MCSFAFRAFREWGKSVGEYHIQFHGNEPNANTCIAIKCSLDPLCPVCSFDHRKTKPTSELRLDMCHIRVSEFAILCKLRKTWLVENLKIN
jgi:hypothetical protein